MRSVTFNGITRIRPGGLTRVNADALNQVSDSPQVMAIVGEADGGVPGEVFSVRDYPSAIAQFKSGPLVDAARQAFSSGADPLVPGGPGKVLLYKVNQSTQSTLQIPSESQAAVSTTAGVGSTTTSVVVAATLTASAHIGRWVDVTLAALPGSPVVRRRVTANSTSALTVTPALPAAPASGNTVVIRSSVITLTSEYGAHTAGTSVDLDYDSTEATYQVSVTQAGVTQRSPGLGGDLFLQLSYRGGSVDISDTTAASSTNTTINLTTGGLTPAAHAGKTAIVNGEYVRISTNGAGSLTLESPGISDANLASLSVGVSVVQILSVTNAVAVVLNTAGPTPGAADRFTTTITGVSGDNLSITFTEGMTLRTLVNTISQNTNYVVEVPDGINMDTALVADFDFGTGTQINIQKDVALNGGLGFKQDVASVVSWINSTSQFVTAERTDTDGLDGHGLGGSAMNDGNPVGGDYPYQMTGGTRGTSTNSNWQTALDALLNVVADEVVVLIDQDLANEGYGSTATWASVSQQLLDHVARARGLIGKERGGWIGFDGEGTATKAEIIAAANGLNDADIALIPQGCTSLDSTGTVVDFTPRQMAVVGASMRCGVHEVAEPLTHKYARVLAVTNSGEWDPANETDAGDLLLAGVMFAETVEGKGIRWVRDNTTWVRDSNLAYTDGSVRDAVRDVAYSLRVGIQDRFTGRKGTPATVSSIKDHADTILEGKRGQNVIVDSTDPITGVVVKAYHNVKVTLTGDVAKICAGIFPVPGINYQLNDLYLQLPTQSS